MPGIWISENQFINFDDRQNDLTAEIAVRSRTVEGLGYFGFLPDPDEVLRKLGRDLTVYRKLLTDAHLWACVLSRFSAVLSCAWQVEENPAGTDKSSKQAYKLINEFMQKTDVHQIVTDILKAPLFGMAPLEIVWLSDGRSWLPEKIAGKPAEWFVFDTENRLRFRSRENMLQGEELPDYKFLLTCHFPDYQNPYGERVLSRCFWPVAFKKGGFKFWAVFTEKWGMPWIVGKVPRSTNITERSQLLGQLVQMVQDAAAVINNDESVEIHEAGGKGSSAAIYERLIDVCNKEMSKAVLGQTATTEGTPGKLGDEESQNDTKQEIVDADKRLVKQTFDLLFQWIAELNFNNAAAPLFAFEKEENVQKDKADRDEVLNRQGVRFKKSYYCRTYNLDETDFDLSATQVRPATDRPPLFAEHGDVASDPSWAPALEALGRKALERADLSPLLQPVEQLLERSASLEEFRDKLLDLSAGLDASALGDLMQQALLLAELSGRFDAAER